MWCVVHLTLHWLYKKKSYYKVVIQIIIVTSVKEVGDSEANYDMAREVDALSIHVLVCIGTTYCKWRNRRCIFWTQHRREANPSLIQSLSIWKSSSLTSSIAQSKTRIFKLTKTSWLKLKRVAAQGASTTISKLVGGPFGPLDFVFHGCRR